jgi:Xaa-Pro aminopeptidase
MGDFEKSADMFDAAVYRGRREALRAGLAARGEASGLVLFLGNRESPMNYEANAYRFRQDSSFLYFFGVPHPNLAAAIDLATGDTTIFGDDVSVEDIVWTGKLPVIGELAAAAGVASTSPRSALRGALKAASRTLYLPPYRAEQRVELAELLGMPIAAVDAGASNALVRSAVALREIKGPEEIAELDWAVEISAGMHRAAIEAVRPGMRESDIAALVAAEAIRGGGDLAFPTIATTRGAVLHNHDHSRLLEAGGIFLLDAGAETAKGYAGDLSTTIPISPRFSPRQRDIYEIVLAAQRAAISLLGPGKPFREAHFGAARTIVEGLSALGLMRGDPVEAVKQGAHALFFPCGVGHMMGLDVHDMENYGEVWVGYDGQPKSAQFGLSSLRLAKPLKAGMAHTVEPGIYFIPELIERWRTARLHEAFINYEALDGWLDFGGMRNEEDWLVTEGGARRLGPDFDKSAAAIEAVRGA